MTYEISLKSQQKRKFLLMLPLLTLPFLTLTFWVLGGGSGHKTEQKQAGEKLINPELPGIGTNGNKMLDKLGHYQKSTSDSARFRKEVKNDPYYRMAFNPEEIIPGNGEKEIDLEKSSYRNIGNQHMVEFQDPNEQLIMEKLEALNRTLSGNLKDPAPPLSRHEANPIPDQPGLSSDLDRLDHMMQQMQTGNDQPDPEMQQMGHLLEKILDIQHPERVKARLQTEENLQQLNAYSLTESSGPQLVSDPETVPDLVDNATGPPSSNEFFGLESTSSDRPKSRSIRAVVHETQTLASGETVKLRMTEETQVNGMTIPKEQLIYGTVSLNGDRLGISIRHVRIADQILPVALTVHDADGMEGIHIPGSLTREVSAQSGTQAMQGFGLSTFGTSLEAQAASAGIETAKSFLSKKVKQVQVTLKAGYQVWLIDKNSRQNF